MSFLTLRTAPWPLLPATMQSAFKVLLELSQQWNQVVEKDGVLNRRIHNPDHKEVL